MINAFLSGALKFAVIISVIIITIVLTMLIVYIARYFDVRAERIEKGNPDEKVTNAVSVLIMIDRLIDSELSTMRDLQLTLCKPFDILHIDKDAEKLSRKIREAINPDILKNKSKLFVTPDYIDMYIVNSCTAKIIDIYKSTNLEIAQIMQQRT